MRTPFRLPRRRRVLCIGLVMFCLLFQQLAMAAYVCAVPSTDTVMTGACAAMPTHHLPAKHIVDARCAEHCADHTPAMSDARVPTPPPLLLPMDWPVLTATLMDRPERVALPDSSLLPPDPPPSLRFCSLLI
ncbi:hypothetical protein [Luteibacter yeojuensis]|uniref:DUF2946 family protein n=1 Tax=Luteibacter yeojuensis TaxID=345309 RepID=A0A7X5TS02_9GAMM|nr:hypothetical protein [Luteibacter yeojuensis]NID17344.1 hypothetical protein [Luteibacter yeojuensis]